MRCFWREELLGNSFPSPNPSQTLSQSSTEKNDMTHLGLDNTHISVLYTFYYIFFAIEYICFRETLL